MRLYTAMPACAWLLVGALLCAPALPALAQEPCADCGGSKFPEANDFLESHGYPPGAFTVLLAWYERARTDEDVFVAGYRVRQAVDSQPFDLYSDADGNLLDPAQLDALGIRPKNWDIRPIEQAADVPKAASLPKAAARIRAAAPASIGRAMNLPAPEAVALAPIDRARIEEEDAERAMSALKSPCRIGVIQAPDEPILVEGGSASRGAWCDLADGGRLWAVTIYSPDARGQRLHFSELALPQGARLILYNTESPTESYGPYAAGRDVWTATCFAELVTVECYVPPGTGLAGLRILLDYTVHVYADFGNLAWGKSTTRGTAQWCENDVTCFPAWATTSLGISGIGKISWPDGMFFCTGTLLADTDPGTDVPYFLTANHCISTQGEADSAEFYWLYQTDTCDGTAPDPSDPDEVPRTEGGADLLATTAVTTGTDFCLLRLRNDPPAGMTFVGWTSSEAAVGSEITCIHHPNGDFKRISFGDITNFDEMLLSTHPRSRFHQVLWSDGTTEGGSSGSPLMLTATHQIIGQLWGGLASCDAPGSPDYYGRFDVSFPLIESWLDAYVPEPEADFSSVSYAVSESSAFAIITVELDEAPGTGRTMTVDYATSNGTALAGADYTAASGTLTFTDDETSETFTVSITDDTTYETPETVVLALSNPVGGTVGSANNPATLTITSDDVDTDEDRLSDFDETNGVFGYVTNPNLWDTDGDGMDDYTEILLGYSPIDENDPPSVGGIVAPWFR
ncbi:MAG: trypsin-like peptidase domain-containing protein [Candidatus Hydrogenedentes bacterium]|nr:trypsin-like peptidase domain-containing protein [Candidatus Hydrogenedentota bacterium]